MRGQLLNHFQDFNLKIKAFEVKMSQKSQKVQNHVRTSSGVICKILKSIKIRDQGMGSGVFVLRLKLCPRGVGEKIMVSFLCFCK